MAAEALLSTKKKNMAGQTVTLQNGQKYTMQGASSGVLGTNPGQGISESTKNYQQRGAFETGDPEFARYSSPKEDQIFSGVSTKTGEISASDGKPNNATVPDGTSAMKNSDGTFNATYVPGSMDEIVSANADDYTKQKWLANYYKDNGMDFGKMPDSQMDEANIFVDNADRKQSEMEKQAATAKAEADRQLAESKSANQAQFAQNREGAVSTGNTMSRDAIDLAMQTRYDSRMADLQSQLQDLTFNLQNAKTGFVREQLNNQIKAVQSGIQAAQEAEDRKKKDSMDLLKLYQDSGALANLSPGDIQALQDGLPGLPPNLVSVLAQSATQKSADEKVKNQLTQLNTFADLAGKGIQLPIDSIFQFSKATGLPAETLYATSQLAAQVMQDKNLSIDEKKTKIADMMYDLNLKQKGILTEAGKKTEELRRLYASGAGADTIRAYKQAAGLTDEEDPMYQADLALKQSQATKAYKEANGIPISADDMAKEAEAREKLSYYQGGAGGSDSYYMPSAPLEGIQVNVGDDGSYNITPPPDKEFQCGAFVNRCWGLSGGSGNPRAMGSMGEEKMATVNKYGIQTKGKSDEELANLIKPGMAFVMPIANNPYDHTGLVKTVLADGIMTIEANANGKAKTNSVGPGKSNVTSRFIPWSQLYGFVEPPTNKVAKQGGGSNSYQTYLNEAKAQGLPYEDAKKYAADKTKKDLSPSGTYSDDQVKLANQYRDEFNSMQSVKDFKAVKDQYNDFKSIVDNKEATGPGDLALIFGFMKALDPNSVVRESEYNAAANSGNIFQGAFAQFNGKFGTGAKLPDEVRKEFMNLVKKRLENRAKTFDVDMKRYEDMAERAGLDTKDVVFDYKSDLDLSEPNANGWLQGAINKITNNQSAAQSTLSKYGIEAHPEGTASSILSKYNIN